jgi:hypothetical protein
MSTHIDDFGPAAVIAAGLAPGTLTASVNGPAIDLISGDGSCFALQQVGTVADETSLTGHIEESPTGTSSWTAITGATFEVVTGSNNVQGIRFTRTARYVRWVVTITGDTPSANVAVLIGEPKKTI